MCAFVLSVQSNKHFIIIIVKLEAKRQTMDPDPNWAKSLDEDPNPMYLGPQHWSR